MADPISIDAERSAAAKPLFSNSVIGTNRVRLALALSICGHGAVIALFLLRGDRPSAQAPVPEISVSLVKEAPGSSIDQEQPMTVRRLSRLSRSDSLVSKPAQSATPRQPALRPNSPIHAAQQTYAAEALSRPENAQAREALRTLAPEERRIQLCNLEAMEQLRRGDQFAAEFVAPYAFGDLVVDAADIVADGAAVRAGDHWRRLRYRCAIGSTDQAPSELTFALGDDIPRDEWSDHFLVAGAPGDD